MILRLEEHEVNGSDHRAYSIFFSSKASDKLKAMMKKYVRVNSRQCKASDTVPANMSKPRGLQTKTKNKFNH